MIKIISLSLLMSLLFITSSCNDASSDGDSASTEVAVKKQKDTKNPPDPVQGIIERLTKNDINLSAEQIELIKQKASTFDLTGETRYEIRVKQKDFRNEVIETILTEEQKAKMKNRTGQKKERKKKNQDEDED